VQSSIRNQRHYARVRARTVSETREKMQVVLGVRPERGKGLPVTLRVGVG
jgi:hypothetical protein